MKNFTFLWVAILGVATAMHGQRITDLHTFSMMPAGLSDAEATAVRGEGESALEVAQRGGGSILFYEDFANGFDGNNGIGGWTVEDTGEGQDLAARRRCRQWVLLGWLSFRGATTCRRVLNEYWNVEFNDSRQRMDGFRL